MRAHATIERCRVGIRLDQGDIDWHEVAAMAAISYGLVAPKELRTEPEPLVNVLTARALVKGAPPALLTDGSALNADPTAQRHAYRDEREDSEKKLRPAAVPGAAIIRRSGGLRGRR